MSDDLLGTTSSTTTTASTNNEGSNSPKSRTKLVLLGETATGKTSLATRFSRRTFHEWQESTIGAAFLTQTVRRATDGKRVRFEIWDTAGQERYHSLASMYYRGAKAAVVVFDITSRDSFGCAKDWIAELRKEGPPGVILALAGNKCDMAARREVSELEAEEYAAAVDALFVETSAKNNVGVDELFQQVAERLSIEQGPADAPSAPALAGLSLLQHANASGSAKDDSSCNSC